MITIERTFDADLVNWILSHESLYPLISDDESLPPDQVDCSDMIKSHNNYFMLSHGQADRDRSAIFGVVIFEDCGKEGCFEIHSNILPEFCGGGRGTQIIRQAIIWVFQNTDCESIIAVIPQDQPSMKATRAAKRLGFVRTGMKSMTYKKNGKRYNEAIMALSKGDLTQQQ